MIGVSHLDTRKHLFRGGRRVHPLHAGVRIQDVDLAGAEAADQDDGDHAREAEDHGYNQDPSWVTFFNSATLK